MNVPQPDRILGIIVVSRTMDARQKQRIDGRGHPHRMTSDRDRQRPRDQLVMGEDLTDDLGIGDTPMDVEAVLDPQRVDAYEGRLVRDQITGDRWTPVISTFIQESEDARSKMRLNQQIRIGTWPTPGFLVVCVRKRRALEHERRGSDILEGIEYVH